MDKKFIFKMIQSCLKQYNESVSFGSVEFEEMYQKINLMKESEKESDLHDIVNDVVYGYITDSPYF
ncbi:hypothetical protein KHA94_13180 [Bacillus sp. FJAT-49705]|uniref:YqzH-like protein n=1 Tax=Cytobacillus citreus TaxID=2833586 RepID=A0ABS5NU88_9BACI|nr:YqzH family protein [Cytobacillus citreus]MBS4191136.1 hypothetical protein [Cytobacillus citreus]